MLISWSLMGISMIVVAWIDFEVMIMNRNYEKKIKQSYLIRFILRGIAQSGRASGLAPEGRSR